MSGWLTKETSGGTLARPGVQRKKRYFILTGNSLDYYRNVDLQQKLGAIALNSLCSVTVPDEKAFKEEGMCQRSKVKLISNHRKINLFLGTIITSFLVLLICKIILKWFFIHVDQFQIEFQIGLINKITFKFRFNFDSFMYNKLSG